MALKIIQSGRLTNITEIYSLANEKKNDINNLTQKHLLYKQFVVSTCNAPLTDYINNPIY